MVTVIVPRSVQITYPADNELISRPDTLVQGTVEGFTGSDIGVTVNGVVAHVYGAEFAANHVALADGDNNTITAFATSSNDYVGKDNITVSAETTGNNTAATQLQTEQCATGVKNYFWCGHAASEATNSSQDSPSLRSSDSCMGETPSTAMPKSRTATTHALKITSTHKHL